MNSDEYQNKVRGYCGGSTPLFEVGDEVLVCSDIPAHIYVNGHLYGTERGEAGTKQRIRRRSKKVLYGKEYWTYECYPAHWWHIECDLLPLMPQLPLWKEVT